MNNTKSRNVAILLATYNSERYIRTQLDSILNQTYTNWILYIRDDGSTDSTNDILLEYMQIYPNKIFIIRDEDKGLRAYGNFIRLLYSIESDFYMFSDHDDVWLPNKIELTINKLNEAISIYGNDIPLLVHTDMMVVDEELNVIDKSFWHFSHLLPSHTKFEELVFCNSINGCTILINQKAKEVSFRNINNCIMHDILLGQSVAANHGKILKVDIPTMLYRQHNNNVVGAIDVNKSYFISKIKSIGKSLKSFMRIVSKAKKIHNVSFLSLLFYKLYTLFLRIIKK